MTPDQWADKAIDAFVVHGHELTGPQRKHLHVAISQTVDDAISANNYRIIELVTEGLDKRNAA